MESANRSDASKKSVKCPQCGWPLLLQSNPELEIVPVKDLVMPLKSMTVLGCMKCARCHKQIKLYFKYIYC